MAPVRVTEHVPEERVQVAELGVTVPPVEVTVNVTVPVGDAPPDMVAVHSVVEPTAKDVGLQETATVGLSLVTVRLVVPELGALSESPGNDAVIVTDPAVSPVMTEIVQAPADRVHVVPDVNAMLPVPDCVQVMVSPEGEPDTVAVQ